MNNTIAAISTPPGIGGIAVVRLSGLDALTIAARHVRLPAEGRTTTFSLFRADAKPVDEVVVTIFRQPHSYTGENMVEISCHGSLYIQQTILQSLLGSGARLAEPGEFTRRAFLNGRLDLSQAEAVADLIDSTNAASHSLAISQLRGGYADLLAQLRQQLVELTSLLELELDFSEEDVEFADRRQLRELVTRLREEVARLVDSFHLGNAIKNGIPVAIVGAPNAGKSTLLNALLNDDRAIVSPIPGTTRDTIEETLVINGIPFSMIDTAGLRQSEDEVERLGIERSRKAMASAEIVLCIADVTSQADGMESLLEELKDRKSLLVLNKADLLNQPRYGKMEAGSICYYVSALTGRGIDELKQGLVEHAGVKDYADSVLLTNTRHYEALRHVGEALEQVSKGLDDNIPADLVSVDLRDALHYLGTITGQVTTDEVLGTIFSRFCVGK